MKQTYLFLLSIFSFGLSQAQIVNIPDANFKNALVNGNVADFDGDGISDGDVDTNNDGEIQLSEATAVLILQISRTNSVSLEGLNSFFNLKEFYMNFEGAITSIEINALSQLETLYLNSANITDIDLSGNPLLTELNLGAIGLAALNVSQNPNLVTLNASHNNLTEIDLTNNLLLETLDLRSNSINSLDVGHLVNLKFLYCQDNEMLSLNISGCSSLDTLWCFGNQLAELDVNGSPILKYLRCYNNQLASLDVTLNPELLYLEASSNQLTTLDLSQNPNLSKLICNYNNLTSINMKNGSAISYNFGQDNFWLSFGWNPNLVYICADQNEISQIEGRLDVFNLNGCSVSTYCSFAPGGDYYTISGNNALDLDSNGCDALDPVFPNLKFDVSNDLSIGSLISGTDGSYFLPVLSGTHTITPRFEASNYFSVSPSSLIVDFPSDTSPLIQDFCIAPNGVYNDLEVYVIPLSQVRPGFEADYKITYKNRGTTILSGDVTLAFNDDLMNLVNSTPSASSQTTGQLTWNYATLRPFESRSVFFKMNMNAPTDPQFPLNGGDVLDFIAEITPTIGDETEPDNTFELHQTVVNSFDPNDITCLEGDFILPEQLEDYVHYVVRFENTGSASAVNVVVKNKIDYLSLDIDSFIPLEGSHPYVTRILNNTVEFIFENIDLPFDDAQNDGYIIYKIKPYSGLHVNDRIWNSAEIYFDFNAPIITNRARTTVVDNLSVEESQVQSNIKVYPNPVKDEFFIESKFVVEAISIYDINGRVLQFNTIAENQFEKRLNLEELNSGIYFVKIATEKGELVKKIIKK